MRQLTIRQKKLLDKVMAEDKEIDSIDTLPVDIWEQLESINNTEILCQEVNRYMNDKSMADIYS